MALKISENEVLAKFDRLVQKGELLYSPPKRLHIAETPFQFQISISPALTRKPTYSTPGPTTPAQSGTSTPSPTSKTTTTTPQTPLFSDPDPDFHIAALSPTHTLILNKFCVLRPQYILHSTIPQSQSDYLNLPDWTAAWHALNAINTRGIVTYNCGQAAGASRSHKHLQILPWEGCVGEEGFRMFPDAVGDEVAKAALGFTYCVSRSLPQPSSGDDDAPAKLKQIYDGLVQQAIEETGFQGTEMAHNMIMVREWMLLVPRSKARVGKCVTGATGVVGMVWVGGEDEVEGWKEEGLLRALGKMGMRGKGKV